MATSRQTIRERFAALLSAGVSAAQTVYDHEPGDLGSATPVIVVSSRGSARTRLTFQGSALRCLLWVDVYTLAAETASGSYTYTHAADVVDSLEQQIAAVMDDNQRDASTGWEAIDYDGSSEIDFGLFNADGIPRFRERIPIAITHY